MGLSWTVLFYRDKMEPAPNVPMGQNGTGTECPNLGGEKC